MIAEILFVGVAYVCFQFWRRLGKYVMRFFIRPGCKVLNWVVLKPTAMVLSWIFLKPAPKKLKPVNTTAWQGDYYDGPEFRTIPIRKTGY